MPRARKVPEGLLLLEKRMKAVVKLHKKGTHVFSMGDFAGFSNGVKNKLLKRFGDKETINVTIKEMNECGTSCCLAGQMTAIPEFRKKGLAITIENHKRDNTDYVAGSITLNDKYLEEETIGSQLLGISYGEANDLFYFDLHETDPGVGLREVQKMISKYRNGKGDNQQ